MMMIPSNSEFIDGIFEIDDFPAPEDSEGRGTLGKNTYSGPHFWTFDMGLFKNFRLPITEESRLQFRNESEKSADLRISGLSD